MNTALPETHARSLLFVPGDRPDRFEKAVESGADCIIIDLEDAVAPAAKDSALREALRWLATGRRAVVRLNAAGTPWHETDVEALRDTGAVIMVPKAQAVDDLTRLSDQLGGDRLLPLVETARGVRDLDDICLVAGVVRVALGNVDLATELGVEPGSHPALAYARSRLVIASAAAGIAPPVDGVTVSLELADQLSDDLRVTRELGFGGKLCIHPRQVGQVNAALSPTDGELAWARRVLSSSAAAGGVGVVDGVMIDPPVVARAAGIVARAPSDH